MGASISCNTCSVSLPPWSQNAIPVQPLIHLDRQLTTGWLLLSIQIARDKLEYVIFL